MGADDPNATDNALSGDELALLVERVFQPTELDTGLAIIVDLPDDTRTDHAAWRSRREMAIGWYRNLRAERERLGLERITLAWYPNVGGNNADLPAKCAPAPDDTVLRHANDLEGMETISFGELFDGHSMLIAPTELSTTAPLKVATRTRALRAATMPGFLPSMIPALRIDYVEVNRRVGVLKEIVDAASAAHIVFLVDDERYHLTLDLRHRTGHASGGLLPKNGVAGNLPSGETYIVPYEGEIDGDPSRSTGTLPVQFGPEVVLYRIEKNKATEVSSEGPTSDRERALIANEPAYANLAELGLGVLYDFGIPPTGTILLDEKLGLHIAFGRSDHFGGIVGPAQFSAPEAVVHIDRVYIPAMQPKIGVQSVTITTGDETREIMRDGSYVGVF